MPVSLALEVPILVAFNCRVTTFTAFSPIMPTSEAQKQHIPNKK